MGLIKKKICYLDYIGSLARSYCKPGCDECPMCEHLMTKKAARAKADRVIEKEEASERKMKLSLKKEYNSGAVLGFNKNQTKDRQKPRFWEKPPKYEGV